MASVNKCIIIGNLGADPENRYMPNGDAVCNIRVATTESWKDKASGEKREITEWHRVVFYRKLAEIAAQYLKKGSQVYLEGRIRTRKWTDKEGVERYTTEIEATDMTMLGKREASNDGGNNDGSVYSRPAQQKPASQAHAGGGGGNAQRQPSPAGGFEDDDIPCVCHSLASDPIFGKIHRVKKLRI